MLEKGTPIIMTKGYKGERGMILDTVNSDYEFYILKLDNGIQIVAGPSAFETAVEEERQ